MQARLTEISPGHGSAIVLVRGYLNGGPGRRRQQWVAALRRGGFSGPVLELQWDASSVLRFATNVVGYRDWRALKERTRVVGGELLPELLSARADVGVTLVGASAGARIVYHCLRSGRLQSGKVADAWLLGGALGRQAEKSWDVVVAGLSGRLVNVYSRRDVVLSTFYRAASGGALPCGTGPIESPHPQVLSLDASQWVTGVAAHGRYFKALERRSLIYREPALIEQVA